MTSTPHIRRATIDDVAAIRNLQRAWKAEHATWGYAVDSTRNIARSVQEIAFVAEAGTKITAFLCAKIRTAAPNTVVRRKHRVCEVLDLFVSARDRRSGLASALLKAVLAECAKRRVRYQYLYSASVDLDPVLGLYRKHGFRSWYVTMYRRGG